MSTTIKGFNAIEVECFDGEIIFRQKSLEFGREVAIVVPAKVFFDQVVPAIKAEIELDEQERAND